MYEMPKHVENKNTCDELKATIFAKQGKSAMGKTLELKLKPRTKFKHIHDRITKSIDSSENNE